MGEQEAITKLINAVAELDGDTNIKIRIIQDLRRLGGVSEEEADASAKFVKEVRGWRQSLVGKPFKGGTLHAVAAPTHWCKPPGWWHWRKVLDDSVWVCGECGQRWVAETQPDPYGSGERRWVHESDRKPRPGPPVGPGAVGPGA